MHMANTGVSKFLRRSSSRDCLWKALYFDRWQDPKSHHAEREGSRLGWKRLYEIKDTAARRLDEHEEARHSAHYVEDEECQVLHNPRVFADAQPGMLH